MISIGRARLVADIATAALPFLGGMTQGEAEELYNLLDDDQVIRTASNAYRHEERQNLAGTCPHHIRGRCPVCERQYRGFQIVPEGSTVMVHAPEIWSPHGPWRFHSDTAARRFIDRWLERMTR